MSTLPMAEIERQCAATKANPKRLPASWWDQAAAENTAEWIKRHVPKHLRLTAWWSA